MKSLQRGLTVCWGAPSPSTSHVDSSFHPNHRTHGPQQQVPFSPANQTFHSALSRSPSLATAADTVAAAAGGRQESRPLLARQVSSSALLLLLLPAPFSWIWTNRARCSFGCLSLSAPTVYALLYFAVKARPQGATPAASPSAQGNPGPVAPLPKTCPRRPGRVRSRRSRSVRRGDSCANYSEI
jgi:hypothetical protein